MRDLSSTHLGGRIHEPPPRPPGTDLTPSGTTTPSRRHARRVQRTPSDTHAGHSTKTWTFPSPTSGTVAHRLLTHGSEEEHER
ncbi:hypothetical protein C1701_24765 [Actinoalloteichus sp. AHMU CJ021]|nr:hypothetical protein C1701_24765 [Actinoalloteichus sp. AHMU CJ021]